MALYIIYIVIGIILVSIMSLRAKPKNKEGLIIGISFGTILFGSIHLSQIILDCQTIDSVSDVIFTILLTFGIMIPAFGVIKIITFLFRKYRRVEPISEPDQSL